MLARTHKMDWEELAALDPMWAILSEGAKRGNKWDVEEFFNTGKIEVHELMKQVDVHAGGSGKALDFGCGVGRLTRGLLGYFREAYGVDISENMIKKARELTPRCDFRVNNAADLSVFADKTFDLVYSNRVLQHQPSAAVIANYVSEFFRVTTPGGLVIFQAPYRKSARNILNLKRSAYHLLKGLGVRSEVIFKKYKLHPMRMTALPRNRVLAIIEKSGGVLLRERPDTSAHFAVMYFCRKAK
jgi:ubiquinone/menaquinone biosynthesis C-methylase UbiE